MGAREDHIEIVRRSLELIERRSYDELRPYLAEDVVQYRAFQPLVRSADSVISAMRRSDEEFGGAVEVESADYFADDNQVVSHERLRLTRGDRTVETEAVHITEFRDGKVSKMTVFTSDPAALASLVA